MFLSYAAKCPELYQGAPSAAEGSALAEELAKTPAAVYLRLSDTPGSSPQNTGEPGVPEGWKLAMVIRYAAGSEMAVEVYTRQAALLPGTSRNPAR